MKSNVEILSEQKFLVFSLLAIGIAILIVNLLDEEVTVFFGNMIYIPVLVAFVVLSIKISIQHKLVGKLGKAWLLFAILAISWSTAEVIWTVYELVLEIDPYPSEADFFWLLGFPFYFGFLMFYLSTVKKAISKNMVLGAVAVSVAVAAPSIFLSMEDNFDPNDIEHIIALSYPIADAFVLAPALIGVALFFTGKVNFLWTLVCFGMLCDVIADTGFLFLELDDTYYTGHPIEILFIWAYLLFSFGVYDHIKLFKKEKSTF